MLVSKTKMKQESYTTNSNLLSTELAHIGYNDINRKTAKEFYLKLYGCRNILETAQNEGTPRCYINVGSQIERTNLTDSDHDILFGPSAEYVAAINNIRDVLDNRINILMVKNETSPPAHVWMKLLETNECVRSIDDMLQLEACYRFRIQFHLFSQCYKPWEKISDKNKHKRLICSWPDTLLIDENDLQFYIPNSIYTLIAKQMWGSKASRTGPSNSSNNTDVVRPIFCTNVYPRDQDPFTFGGNLYGNLHVPKEYPCNLVPVGHPESEDESLEWRISYNLTEREIMFGFNTTHFQTYVVLKMLKRSYFKQFVGDGFTSFHCKTALFYAVATTEKTIWVKSNLINCVRQCLNMIRLFAKTKFCPHFFNKSFNLFSGKLPRCGKHWEMLIDLAFWLSKNTNTYFTQVEIEKNKYSHIESASNESTDFALKCISLVEQVNRGVLFCYLVPGCLAPNVRSDVIRSMRAKYKTLQRKLKGGIAVSQTAHQRECVDVVLSIVKVRHYLLSAAYLLEQGKELNLHSTDNLLPDALSMELQVSSLMFANGKYEMARTLLERVFIKIISDPIFFVKRHDNFKLLSRNDYLEFINRYSGPFPITEIPRWTFIKRYVSLQVIFHVHELCLLHSLLRFEAYRFLFEDRSDMCRVEDKWQCIASFDPIPFFFFMQYLIYKELGLEEQKYEALVRLEVCITYSSLSSPHVAMNMLGNCCELEWNYIKAVRSYAISLRMQPQFNAAKFHIAILVWRMWVNHNVELLQAGISPNVLSNVD